MPSVAPVVRPPGAATPPKPPPVLALGQVAPPIAPSTTPPQRPGARPTMSLPALAPAGSTPPRPPPAVPPAVPAIPGVPPIAPVGTPPRASSTAVPAIPSVAPAIPPAATAVTPPPPPSATKGLGLDVQQLADLEARCAKLDQLDYFELLMLERTATPADIKRAFYRESRTYHPDRFFHVESKELKERVNELYKRVTEAYYVLRDDTKRKKYVADVSGPERAQKLRFTEASEAETKAAAKKEQEEQIGTHPKGRQFFQQAQRDADAGNWAAAERNLKMALTYEPANARYKERLAEVQKQSQDEARDKGGSFKIR
ncbi:DnaJ domain-containing protein [Myxococcus sp. Y35]|uniref:J domain-containing protein n=1 Tax=Pseudomyxococcus flavus TaxID=3115648 RepID=UPI003CF349CB